MADTFNIALVQLALGGTPEQNLEKSLPGCARPRARAGR